MLSTLPFQYNPETLRRTLQNRGAVSGAAPSEALRIETVPKEEIQVEAELDATDGLEHEEEVETQLGLHAQLAALEMLLYPSSTWIETADAQLAQGSLEVFAPEGPLTVFVWGNQRVLPVRLSTFSIEESFYDNNLNPIHAKVSLGLEVLGYDDLPLDHAGRTLFKVHHQAKEAMAQAALGHSLQSILPGGLNF